MRAKVIGACLAIVLSAGAGAWAQPADQPQGAGGQPSTTPQPATSDQPAQNGPVGPPSIQSSLGPYGDPGGVRKALSSKGIDYSLTYIGEVLGNASGGQRRGAIYEGRFDLQIDADLEKLFGWQGAALHTNLYQIHGQGLSRDNLGNLLTVSGIEALPSTRLYELWFEQKLFDGKAAVRIGQLAADTEFFVSQTAGLFVNATFGWPGVTALDLPSGGPAYPLATPAVRVKIAPTDALSVLIGLFNGDPAGPPDPLGVGPTNPQALNPSGVNFRLRDPPLLIAEADYAYNRNKDAPGLPGTVKLGFWRHFGSFGDQRLDTFGGSLASPLSTGVAARHSGNDGVYAIVDQTLSRVAGTDDQGASVFARLSASPGDRNLVDFYADAGVAYKGLVPGRPNDTAGVSFAYLKISDAVSALDRDTIFYSGTPIPVRSSESLIEATYQAEIVPGWTVQPDFQYIFNPGGGIVNPLSPIGARIHDAAVFGLRTTVRY